jgi:hypothetical protein
MSHRLIQRLNTVGDEFEAARSALLLTTGRWPILHQWEEVTGQRLASFQLAERNLEATYVVRLFAEFEAILRAQYPHSRPGRPVPRRSFNLINSLGSRYAIPAPMMVEVHRIREFRHSIAHADPGAPPVSFTDALSWLNRYLACIPDADVPD